MNSKNLVLIVFVAALLGMMGCKPAVSDLTPVELTCEYLKSPHGIDVLSPRLSWHLSASGRGRKQTAYRILVASTQELIDQNKGDLWDTQKTTLDKTVNIPYQGKELASRTSCYWKVMVWDEHNVASDWSATSVWTMGLLNPTDWEANWIGFDEGRTPLVTELEEGKKRSKKKYEAFPLPHFRKQFQIDSPVSQANAYITALGIYELFINGQRVGEDYFAPGWTDYNKRIYYNTYDVSSLLQEGENTVAVVVADGWYAGNIGIRGQRFYGDKLRLKMQLEMQLDDASTTIVLTDASWKASYGAFIESDMQAGETYDARLEMPGWKTSDFDDSDWKNVVVSDTQTAVLQSYPGVTVQKTEERSPTHIFEREPGVYIVDMGQNFAGWAKLDIQGTKGDSVVMRFAEKLNADSSLHVRNLRTARCTDTYVVGSSDKETWEPTFTYHGYQFIEITGYPGQLTADNIKGVVLHTNMEKAGLFESSNPLLNKIYSNIVWSQRSNFFEVPTDCPQRDERIGWTGDAQVFMQTASYNMNIAPFFTKWLTDVADAQTEDGQFPSTAPMVYKRVASGWGDASIICPWYMYQTYDDQRILERFYPLMVKWMEHLDRSSENYICGQGSFGDWQNVDSETPKKVMATAYYKHDADLMAKMAHLLNKPEDASMYESLSSNIKKAFNKEFVNDSVQIEGNTQTGYLMALAFDLLPETERPLAVQQLVRSIEEHNNSLTTGILGTQLLLPTLSNEGELDMAYDLLLSTQFPSWGHQIENGATTIWERWDGYSRESGFHEDVTNSFNHYAFGSVGEWMFSTIAGVQAGDPGYKRIFIRPQPGGGLTHARAEYTSAHGLISSGWKTDNGQFELDVTIPPNTEALVFIPTDDIDSITESGTSLSETAGVIMIAEEEGKALVQIGSGTYRFTSTWTK